MSILRGDCIEVMRTLEADSIDAIVTDPPYGIAFMGQEWDNYGTGSGGTQTVEERRAAGLHYQHANTGAPRYANSHGKQTNPQEAHNFGKWCERWAREAYRILKPGGHLLAFGGSRTYHRLAAGIEDAGFEIRDQLMWIYASGFPKSHNLDGEWSGWGTALKPAHEPIVLARKPLVGTVAANVQAHGTGALNIDGCRIAGEPWKAHTASGLARDKFFTSGPAAVIEKEPHDLGRWPANVVITDPVFDGDSRFFLVPKAPRRERVLRDGRRSPHPTQKPEQLIRHLVTMVTPPGGIVLDPFLGSGTLGVVCEDIGVRWLGIEREAEYADWARDRLADRQPEWVKAEEEMC